MKITLDILEELEYKYVEVILKNNEIIRGEMEIGNGGIYSPYWCTVGNSSFKTKDIKSIREVK